MKRFVRLIPILIILISGMGVASELPEYKQDYEFKKREEPEKEEGFIPKEKAEEISASESYLLEKHEQMNFFRNKSNLRNYRIRKLQKELEGEETANEVEEQLKRIKARETDVEKEQRLEADRLRREKLLTEDERFKNETDLKEALKQLKLLELELLLINGFDPAQTTIKVTPIDELIKVRADEFPTFRETPVSPTPEDSYTPPTLRYLRDLIYRESIRDLFTDQEDQSGYKRFRREKK